MIEAWSALPSDRRWWLALLSVTCLVLIVNPLGYIGGGWDDWQYLNAVRCWRQHGPCLPHDHWQGRWPVIAPVALITWLFGESRLTVGIAPFLGSLLCLFLIAVVGNRLLGKPVGWLAAMLMVATPAFSIQILDITVESVELAFVLLGLLAILHWAERPRWYLALLAGLAFSFAVQVRETALIATLFAAVYACVRRRPRFNDFAWGAVGFLLPFAVEFVIFAMSTGDPFWRRRLSLNHTNIPSSELQVPVDPARSPLLNPEYIANWRREPGIHVFWVIDGLLNLFADAKAGLSLSLVPLIALVIRDQPTGVRRSAWLLWGSAMAYACVLIYVFAIDPKARMMFMPLAMTNTALALLAWQARERHRLVAGAACLATVATGIFILFSHQRTYVLEEPAAQWLTSHPGQVEIDENTRRHLALLPAAERLPPLGSGRQFLIYNSPLGCEVWVNRSGLQDSFAVAGEVKISRMGWLQPRLSGGLCFLRYIKPVPAEVVAEAIIRSRPDGKFIMAQRRD